MITVPTNTELETLYLALAKAKYPTSDITQLSDFQAKAAAVGGLAGRIALDGSNLFSAVYPQNGDPFGINTQLSAKGVPSQLPASATALIVTVDNVPLGRTYQIDVGTNLISADNQLYKIVSSDGISTSEQVNTSHFTLYLVSVAKGANTVQALGSKLTFSPAQMPIDDSNNPLTSVTIIEVISGTDEESIASTANRLIEIQQTPLDAVRSTDIKYEVLDANLGINDAIVLINNEISYVDNPRINTAVFLIGNNPVNDDLLNKGLVIGTVAEVYTRSVNNSAINETQINLINNQTIGLHPTTSTVVTQGLTTNAAPAFIRVSVSINYGYDLTSKVVLAGGVTLTLAQLIKREVRRAICAQPFGALLVINPLTGSITVSSIPIGALENAIDYALGTPTTVGTIGTYISNRMIQLYVAGQYTSQASIPLTLGLPSNQGDKLPWVYDVSLTPADIYSNIEVVLL